MADTMKAVVLHKAGDLRLEEVPCPGPPAAEEVKVRVRSVGVCGSDVHYFQHGRIGDFVVEKPMLLGHECAGEVVEVGSAVSGLRPGDRVAMEPGIPCRKCPLCKQGRYNLCPEVRFWATPPIDGSLAEYVLHPADFCYLLPEGMSTAEGAMMEPLAVGVHACNLAGIRGGDSVAVLGAGPIGLLAMQAALAQGATTAIAADISPARLEVARSLGATHIISPQKEDAAERIMQATNGRGVDVVLECSGAAQAISQAADFLRRGGSIVWIGMPHPVVVPLDLVKIEVKEARTCGVFRYANAYHRAIELAAAGRIKLAPLISAHYSLEDAVEAVKECASGAAERLKVVIDL